MNTTKTPDTIASEKWAETMLKKEFLVLDTETTGLGASDQICEIAVCDSRGHALINTLVRPTVPVHPGAFKVHGITNEQLATAPLFLDIHSELVEIFKGKPVVIYNAQFDRRLVRQCCDVYQLPYPRCREFHCAMQWYSQWYGWQNKKGGYRKKPLPNGDHSALGDCLALLRLIRQMAGESRGLADVIPIAR